MLPKEKPKLDHENCYLLGENKLGYGLIYLVETPYEYELIYKDKEGYINQIDPTDGYRLYEPKELYHLIEEFVISNEDIILFMRECTNIMLLLLQNILQENSQNSETTNYTNIMMTS